MAEIKNAPFPDRGFCKAAASVLEGVVHSVGVMEWADDEARKRHFRQALERLDYAASLLGFELVKRSPVVEAAE